MSRPSQKRKKFARKPTPRCATLETIREDEDLVATATLSTLQGPDVLALKAFQKSSKRGRRRKAKTPDLSSQIIFGSSPPTTMSTLEFLLKGTPAQRGAVSRTEASDALEALWNEIDATAKGNLTNQLGQLAAFVDQKEGDLIRGELEMIQLNLRRAQTVFVTPFMTILREGTIETLRDMKALADVMLNNRVEKMDVVIVAKSPPSDGDTSMGNASDRMSDVSAESDSESDKSIKSASG